MPLRLSRQEIEAQIADIRARRSTNAVGLMDFEPSDPFAMAASEGGNKGTETSPWINPGKMSDAQRLELLRKIEGKEILSLNFWAYCFGDGGNQNRLHVTPKQVKQLAKSASRVVAALDGHGGLFSGSPASSIVGEVNRGRADLVGTETKLALAHRITKPTAMEAVARGEWRWFSISLNADDFEFEFLDADGEVVDDWDEIVDYRVTAVGNCWLTHNAFVGDPAWLGSEYLARAQGGALPKEMATMPTDKQAPPANSGGDDVVKLKSDLAAAQARVGELEAQLKAEREAHFNSVFDSAKAQAKTKEGERELYQLAAQAKGVEFVRLQLAARDPLVALRPVGESGASVQAQAPAKQSKASQSMTDEEAEAEVERLGLAPRAKKKK